jgi:hypothetical protein
MKEETARTILEFITEIQKSESGKYERVMKCEQCNGECFVNENFDDETDYVICDICEYGNLIDVVQLTDKSLQPELTNVIDSDIFCGDCVVGHVGCNGFCEHLQMDDRTESESDYSYDSDDEIVSDVGESDYSYDGDGEVMIHTPLSNTITQNIQIQQQIISNPLQQMKNEELPTIIKKKRKYKAAKKCPHSKVKFYCRECGGGLFCKHGKNKYKCAECDGSQLCKHGKDKTICKECGGSQICKHGNRKPICKECGGSRICKHGINKQYCKECDGSAWCSHGKIKVSCRECGGSMFCKHDIRKANCKECGGWNFCTHGKEKRYCKDCNGSGLCVHGKVKYVCKECDGSQICEHSRNKHSCTNCNGVKHCPHGKNERDCKECGGSRICKHDKRKDFCKECGGSGLCKSAWCETTGNKKYNGYCLHCFIHLFPDEAITHNYKTKESAVVNCVKTTFPNYDWITDKQIKGGCSKRRPDIFLDLGSHIIIIEIDEHHHSDYDDVCENRRTVEISKDVNYRSIVFIRFNPDAYVDEDGNRVSSCWTLNKKGVMHIHTDKEIEWNERLEKLMNEIELWINTPIEQMMKTVHLFY